MRIQNLLLRVYPPTKSASASLCVLLLTLLGSGCVSQKPLPFAHGTPAASPTGAPALAVTPAQNLRPATDNEDKVLQLPECLDPVMVKEFQTLGMFSNVALCTNGTPKEGYVLHCQLKELRWEVPHYESKVATAAVLSVATGAVGGIIYGCTRTDVMGHASVHFCLENAQTSQRLLDHDFAATEKRRTSLFNCDTSNTMREVSADALRTVFNQFESELKALDLKPATSPGNSATQNSQ